jgi:SAM-dependent methyltransferase
MLGENEMLGLITTWLPSGGRVLDVGCGSGRMLKTLVARGISGMGIDPYASDTERCRRLRAEEVDQLLESFDLVYMRYTLHHLDVPQQFPHKARSLLHPGGVLLIVDWVEGARTGVAERYFPSQAVAGWVCEAGFQLMCEDVRGQTMVIVGELPSAALECTGEEVEED